MVEVGLLCAVRPPPLETVGGVGDRDPGRGHLQAPPLTGRTGEARLASLEERRAQPGPSLQAWGLAGQLADPPGSQLQPLPSRLVETKVTVHFPLRGRGGVSVVTQLGVVI